MPARVAAVRPPWAIESGRITIEGSEFPIDQAHLLGPESVPVFERTTMEVWVIHVRVSSAVRFDNRGCHARSRSSAAALRE